jgi:hypothetical protein
MTIISNRLRLEHGYLKYLVERGRARLGVLQEVRIASSCNDEKKSAGIEMSVLKKQLRAHEQTLMKVRQGIALMIPITPSINRRLDAVHYHYENWFKVIEKGTYAAQLSVSLGGDGYINAPKYNAEVIAFLQNTHALCDSLPYVLNLYLRAFDLERRDIGWKKDKLRALRDAAAANGEVELAQHLESFAENTRFLKLQDIVNCSKHKHLVPMFLSHGKVFFAKLDGSWTPSDIDVHEFMVGVDNELLGQVEKMLQLAADHPVA